MKKQTHCPICGQFCEDGYDHPCTPKTRRCRKCGQFRGKAPCRSERCGKEKNIVWLEYRRKFPNLTLYDPKDVAFKHGLSDLERLSEWQSGFMAGKRINEEKNRLPGPKRISNKELAKEIVRILKDLERLVEKNLN